MAQTERPKKKTTTPAPVEHLDTSKSPVVPNTFSIVGIGASAGGLAAFEPFFSSISTVEKDLGMAFVIVQHLAPDHKSMLCEIIQRYTKMQVFEVEDGMIVAPNCIYIIPPGRDMALINGSLQLLQPFAPHGQRLPIDFFFRSLALDLQERAIGIVLSGTGSDGSMGVRAIKGKGGMVIAQSVESSEYDGMPRSAIATGMVDYELTPAKMLEHIINYTDQAFRNPPNTGFPSFPQDRNLLSKIFVLLREQKGQDFSQYKQSTIQRRIQRRMAIHQIETMEEYLQFLQKNPLETETLFYDMLIGVTNFFRDPSAFLALQEKVLPKLFANRSANSPIRIWVPGCSTGEEAYSLAILLYECLEKMHKNYKIIIFATDIDSKSLAIARLGVYPASIMLDISQKRLERFFTPEPDESSTTPTTYRIQKRIRDLLVFSEQSVINDPPFSKLDLISCRNLMIYFDAPLQKKLIPLFH